MTTPVNSVAVNYDPFADAQPTLAKAFVATEAQMEMWNSIAFAPEASCAFNESITLSLSGTLHWDALQASLNDLLQRHEILRASFSDDGKTIAILSHAELPIRRLDNATISLAQLRANEAQTAFDLINGPLIRASVLREHDTLHHLVLTAHHIACDGWSLAIVIRDLAALYSLHTGTSNTPLPPAVQFSDYAAFTHDNPQAAVDEAYWLDIYKDYTPDFELPNDLARPMQRTFASKRIDFAIELAQFDKMKATAAKHDASITGLLLSTLFICVSRWSDNQKTVVGIPTAGQMAFDANSLVGHCVNMLPILAEVDSHQPYTQLLDTVGDKVLTAFEHQHHTFGELLKKLPIQRDASRIPLMPISFNFDQGIQGKNLKFGDLRVAFFSNPRAYENFELFFNAADYGDNVVIECQYNTDLFSEAWIMRRLEEWRHVLLQVCDNPSVRIADLQLIDRDTVDALMTLARGPQQTLPAVATMPALLQHSFDSFAQRSALVAHDGKLSYAELQQRADTLAVQLQAHGAAPGRVVAVCLPRSSDLLVSLLAVLKTGAAYIPLDSAWPHDRLHYMLHDAGCDLAIANAATHDVIAGVKTIVRCDQLDFARAQTPTAVAISADAPAYLIYTSGSSGKPKGVKVPHKALVNFLLSMQQAPALSRDDVLLAVTTISFDIAALELYLPLLCGARIVLANSDEITNGQDLLRLINEHQVTVIQATPASWKMLIAAGWRGEPKLKALVGGEALPKDLANTLRRQCRELWNMYGPTETTVWSTCKALHNNDDEITLGHAIHNTDILILDSDLNPCPQGVPGELCIGGDGVALGYHNRDDLTQAAFIPSRFYKGRLYRTGDKAKLLANGDLSYFGRRDQQIKLRGYRIELGEIEAVIMADGRIRDAAAAVMNVAGQPALVAFVVCEQLDAIRDDLRTRLLAQLPRYMVPDHFQAVATLPRTQNQKLDRKAVAKLPLDSANRTVELQSPSTTTEVALLAIWQQVLSVQTIGVNQDFFDLGGHSALITQMIYEIEKQLKVKVRYRDAFTHRTITALAEFIDHSEQQTAIQIVPRAAPHTPAPLSLAQRSIWYVDAIQGESTLYNLPSAHHLLGPLNVAALDQALDTMVSRQESLRSRITMGDHGPVQTVLPHTTYRAEKFDLSTLSGDAQQTQLNELFHQLQAHTFKLEHEAPFRAALITLSDVHHIIFFMAHHQYFDGWSFDLFIRELTTGYRAATGDASAQLPTLPIQYADFCVWQQQWLQSDELKKQIDYWLQLLKGELPKLEMPLDFARPAISSSTGDQVSFDIDGVRLQALEKLAHKHGVSLFMVIYAVYVALLHRYTEQDDIIVGVPIADRTKPGTQHLIGFFVNSLVMRFSLQSDMRFSELLAQVKEQCLSGYNNQDAPFERLVELLGQKRDLSRAPLFQTSITYQDVSQRETQMGDIAVKQLELHEHNSPLDLNIWLKKRGDKISAGVIFKTSLFEKDTITHFVAAMNNIVDDVVQNEHKVLKQLRLADDRNASIQHGRTLALPACDNLAQFVLNNGVDANKIAVRDRLQQLSYGQLTQQSLQVAAALQQRGIQAGDVVGVALQRSAQLLPVLLGIWRAGAAYLPLDPDFPHDRLRYMIDDAQAKLLIVDATTTELAVNQHSVNVEQLFATDGSANAVTISARHPAYLIYTSGSTGLPKGVEVPVGAVVNFLCSMRETPGLTSHDVMLAITTLSFDISVLELFLPMLTGAEVVIASKQETVDGQLLLNLLQQFNVTCMQATPSSWRLLLAAKWAGNPQLKALCGGEALPHDLATELLTRVASLWNMYGPTETTVWSTCKAITTHHNAITLGNAIANTDLIIVDEQLAALPRGAVGELCIGGAGVSSGYWKKPELTQERFFRNSAYSRDTIYRTGDKARVLANGEIQYLGRVDQQVKLRGFRIELGEIETRLRQLPTVADAAVAVTGGNGLEQRLVAFVVWQSTPQTLTEVRKQLAAQLPNYMIPQQIETLAALPRTNNGKLDRKALMKLQVSHVVNAVQTPLQTDNERWLAALWAEQLGGITVSRHDNFFEIGGHSLLAMHVINKVRLAGRGTISLRDLLREDLAVVASQLTSTATSPELVEEAPASRGIVDKLLSGFGFSKSKES